MIARYWRGRVRTEDTEAYAEYVRRTGVDAHRATTGNIGSMVLVHREEKETEIVVVSLWESIEAIRGFAGDDPEKAVFFPDDTRFLTAADPVVTHYEVPVFALDVDAVR
jgi:heme-degrading monooxygenase HmoA